MLLVISFVRSDWPPDLTLRAGDRTFLQHAGLADCPVFRLVFRSVSFPLPVTEQFRLCRAVEAAAEQGSPDLPRALGQAGQLASLRGHAFRAVEFGLLAVVAAN